MGWERQSAPPLYCDSGRSALALALTALRLTHKSNVVVPALNCEVVIETLAEAGVGIRYYDVPETLEPAAEAIEAAMDADTACVYVVHYFGFPMDLRAVRQICDDRGVALIEDCAHALLSAGAWGECGSVGDLALFSLRKFLPMPAGGALVGNNAACRAAMRDITLKSPPAMDTIARSAFLLMKHYLFAHGEMLRAAKRVWQRKASPTGEGLESPRIEALSSLGMRILRRAPVAAIREARQQHYRFWRDVMSRQSGVQILRPAITPATCPYSFPVLIENRDDLLKRLEEAGVSLEATFCGSPFIKPGCTPASPAALPSAQYIGDHLLSFPVHQALTKSQLGVIADRVVSAMRMGRAA
jgi:perosamine synthetase